MKEKKRMIEAKKLCDDLARLFGRAMDEGLDSHAFSKLVMSCVDSQPIIECDPTMESPFANDPFPIVYRAFKSLFPDKECVIFYGVKEDDGCGGEGHGYTFFPDDGTEPEVTVFSENDTNVQAEILAHELAHVAVGQEHEHDQVWEDAFDAIHTEFCRLSDEVFCWITEEVEEVCGVDIDCRVVDAIYAAESVRQRTLTTE